MKNEYRNCFKCSYEAVIAAARCPRCGYRMHTAGKIRLLGAVGASVGGLVTLIIGAVLVFIVSFVTHPAAWNAKITADDDPQLIFIFSVLLAIFGCGAFLSLAGVWQLIFARRNKFLIYAAFALLFVGLVGGRAFSFILRG